MDGVVLALIIIGCLAIAYGVIIGIIEHFEKRN